MDNINKTEIPSESLVSFMPIGIHIVDTEGNILFINKETKNRFGGDIAGKRCWELYKDDKSQCPSCPLLKKMKEGDSDTIEVEGCLGGKTFLITHIAIVYQGKQAVMEIFQDITQRKKNEMLIRDLAKFPSENPNPVLRVSKEGKVLYSNRSCQLQVSSWDCTPNADVSEDIMAIAEEVLKTDKIKVLERKEGMRTFIFYAVPIKEGGYVNMYGLDITARLEAEKKAKEAVEMEKKLTAVVSHEIKTPLTLIRDPIDMLLEGFTGALTSKQRQLLETSKRNIDRLVRLANDFLDFQKMESGKIEFDIQENDINEVIREVYITEKVLAEQKGLALTLLLDDNLPRIRFDKDRIIQVLVNLIGNAIKYTKEGGVRIITERGDNIICVKVADTGPGIPTEDIPKLFQSFERVNRTEDKSIEGTGLGLVICKDIIAGHNGKIWAESKAGGGTTFAFILPIEERRASGTS